MSEVKNLSQSQDWQSATTEKATGIKPIGVDETSDPAPKTFTPKSNSVLELHHHDVVGITGD